MIRRIYCKQDLEVAVKEKFGDQFDLTKFEYIKAKAKSIVTCKDHGDFMQSADKLMQLTWGCPKCSAEKKVRAKPTFIRPTISKEEYLERCYAKYGDKFHIDMSQYIGMESGSVTLSCSLHGDTTYIPRSLLISKNGCRHCGIKSSIKSRTRNFEEFINQANKIHNFKYQYITPSDFTTRKSSCVEIICPIHGSFSKNAQKHLSGQGCFHCAVDKLILDGNLPGGYCKSMFDENPEMCSRNGILYYLKVGRRYKIGITINLNRRLSSIRSQSKQNVEVLSTYESTLIDVYNLEQSILSEFVQHRILRPWTTELFEIDVLNGQSLTDYFSVK